MEQAGTSATAGLGRMQKRRTTMEDGRYLIYYTFDDSQAEMGAGDGGAAKKAEPKAEPVAEEERRV